MPRPSNEEVDGLTGQALRDAETVSMAVAKMIRELNNENQGGLLAVAVAAGLHGPLSALTAGFSEVETRAMRAITNALCLMKKVPQPFESERIPEYPGEKGEQH